MLKHEEKICPRCNGKFECKLGSILLCQCTTVKLNDAERSYIKEQYNDCLCAVCMKGLKAEYHNSLFKEKLKKVFGIFFTTEK